MASARPGIHRFGAGGVDHAGTGVDHEGMSSFERGGLFGGVFGRGPAIGDQAWLQAMLDVEAALARAAESAGLAESGAGAAVTAVASAGQFDVADLGRQTALTGNPVPALVRALTAKVPPAYASAVHAGATSQDVIDTAVMLLARRALDQELADLAAGADAAAALARRYQDAIMIGRTLLQQAVPVTFGLVAAGWLTGIDEARQRLALVRAQRLAIQFGGAAGTLAALGDAGPRVSALLAGELDLRLPVLPWHTDRVRIIELAAALAGAAAAVGKVARDVTLLAQAEVAEVREGDSAPKDSAAGGPGRRGGSSAMPNKRNPVAAIAILGCTRQVPGLLATLAASAEHEHQRAAGAWHAEWEPLSGLLRLSGSAAAWATDLLAGLEADTSRMRANLDAAGGLPMAGKVAGLLSPALGRAAAHELVARASAHAVASGRSLGEVLGAAPYAGQVAAAGVDPAEVQAALDPAGYLGSARHFIRRALAAHREQEGARQ
jgi:3-carboxy-cis,cis-muconate cycloisomerase